MCRHVLLPSFFGQLNLSQIHGLTKNHRRKSKIKVKDSQALRHGGDRFQVKP